jgi:hypothetical protein
MGSAVASRPLNTRESLAELHPLCPPASRSHHGDTHPSRANTHLGCEGVLSKVQEEPASWACCCCSHEAGASCPACCVQRLNLRAAAASATAKSCEAMPSLATQPPRGLCTAPPAASACTCSSGRPTAMTRSCCASSACCCAESPTAAAAVPDPAARSAVLPGAALTRMRGFIACRALAAASAQLCACCVLETERHK